MQVAKEFLWAEISSKGNPKSFLCFKKSENPSFEKGFQGYVDSDNGVTLIVRRVHSSMFTFLVMLQKVGVLSCGRSLLYLAVKLSMLL